MNFIVADLMQEHRDSALATPQAWIKIMQALRRIGWDRMAAKGANRLIFVYHAGLSSADLSFGEKLPDDKGPGR